MNIYDDYINYLSECMEILDKLRETSSPLNSIIDDVIKVTDYIYQQYDKKIKIDDDLEEIFSLGFGYLSNVLTEIKTYYEDSFDKNINKLNEYATLIIDFVILEDFKSFLDVDDHLTDEKKTEIDLLMSKIDKIIANNKNIPTELNEEVNLYIEDNTPQDSFFQPVYMVYAMIAEELMISSKM